MDYYLSNNNEGEIPKNVKRRMLHLSKSLYFGYSKTGDYGKEVDFMKLEEFYGYINTDLIKRQISLLPDDVDKYKFILNIQIIKHDFNLILNNIKELPTDINTVINSYLWNGKKMKWSIELSSEYPFRKTRWTLLDDITYGVKKCPIITEKNKRKEEYILKRILCGSITCTQFIEKEILNYLTTLVWFN